MKRAAIAFCTAVLLVLPAAAKPKDDKAETERLKKAAEVLDEVMAAPDDSIPSDLLARAGCVLVVPGMKKGALGIGGAYGRGAVACRAGASQAGPWGPPSMITIGGGSFGLQLGMQSTDVIALIMNRRGVDHLLKSQFTIGGDATAAAGPKGRSAAAATDATMGAEILTYARARGLFAGVSLNGTVVRPNEEANRRLYGKAVTAKEVLEEGALKAPEDAQPFIAALEKYAPRNVSAKPAPRTTNP